MVAIALCSAPVGAQTVFDERGFQANRDFFSQLPFEHIDPLTGNLLLTFTDLVLPGNAGFDLRIQRTYNSKIYRDPTSQGGTLDEDSWAGVGWTLHMGRAFGVNAGEALAIEMPDGRQHRAYQHVNPPAGCGACFITRGYWIYDKNTHVLKLPNGLVYTFGHAATINQKSVRYATEIRDPFGNTVSIQYGTTPVGRINSITQSLGSSQTRMVTFGVASTPQSVHLSSMTYNSGSRTHTWTYGQGTTDAAGFTILTSVTPPIGPGWIYGYNSTTTPKWELTSVTTPNGGRISYQYLEFTSRLGSPSLVKFRGVSRRTAVGRTGDAVPQGVWDFAYAQGTAKDQSTISSPCGSTTYTFLGVGNASPVATWNVGLINSKSVSDGIVTRTDSFTWRPPLAGEHISNDDEWVGLNHSSVIYVPLLERQTINVNGQSFRTDYEYNTTAFNDFGQAKLVTETGDAGVRSTSRVYKHTFTPYIRGRLDSETVTFGGVSFASGWTYNSATGFKASETIRGITTTFTPDARGNVASATNGNNHTTSYTYNWGRVDDTTTPHYVINRTINADGTVASELRRGLTTAFQYDLLFRPTRVDPPVGTAWVTTYDNGGGTFTRLTRADPESGSAETTTFLDGFGRPNGMANTVGVKTSFRYDACGRRNYVGYPFTGTGDIGTSLTYDALGRVRTKRNPDNSQMTYTYNGIDVTIQDENGHSTFQNWAAFGDPEQPWLMDVTEPNNKKTFYQYNTLGSLTRVTPPAGGIRQWTYYGNESGGKPGLLKQETHPESGTVSYTYDAAGNLKTRTDPGFGSTQFNYDGNERLIAVDRPGTAHDATFGWDASDNRTSVTNGFVSTTWQYTENNLPRVRTDVINGQSFVTTYRYWDDDVLRWIDYPSGRRAYYRYDRENRISHVQDGATPSVIYADGFAWHPSGAVAGFKPGGSGSQHGGQAFGYHPQRYWPTTVVTGVRSLTYGYSGDQVGNVRSITDTRPGMNRSFTYDNLDRLQNASGFWGSGTYTYDDIGNRTNNPMIAGSSGWTYSSNRLVSAGGAGSFTYDANGNMLGDGSRTYTYTPANMVQTSVAGGVTTTYRYDADNIRKLKVTGDETRYFIHGPGNQLLAEHVQCGSGPVLKLQDYIYAGSRLLASVEEDRPTVSVTSVPAVPAGQAVTVVEGAGFARFAVTITTADGQPLGAAVTVKYRTVPGSATPGVDYTPVSGTLTFAANTPNGTSQLVDVPIINDKLVEPDETFTFELYEPSCGLSLGASAQTVIIEDDDPTVAFLSPASSVSETTPAALLPVRITTSHGKPTTHAVIVSYQTADGTAVSPGDYVGGPGTLTIPTGSASGSNHAIAIPIVDDLSDEFDETFTVTIASGDANVIAPSVHTVTILDDDPPPVLSIDQIQVTEGDSGTVDAVFTVSVSIPSGKPITVNYATANGQYAVAGQDYVATAGTLSFAPGVPFRTIAVPVIGDLLDEHDETFLVQLSGPSNATLGQALGMCTILDNDPLPVLSIGDAVREEGDEGLTPATLAVTLSPVSGRTVVSPWQSQDGTAVSGEEGEVRDYIGRTGTVVIPEGETQHQIAVDIVGDGEHESDETFSVLLHTPGFAELGDAEGTVTILNDDPVAVPATELTHGRPERREFGPSSAQHWFRVGQKAHSSYEVLVDSLANPTTAPVVLQRLGWDATTVLQSGQLLRFNQTMRWENARPRTVSGELIQLRGETCSTECASYRIELRETTYSIPRFNNLGTQTTAVLIQNPQPYGIGGTFWFWSQSGELLGSHPFTLASRSVLSLNTTTVSGVAGQAGSITVSHDGRYGDLVGKAVSLESGTSFAFDTPMVPVPR